MNRDQIIELITQVMGDELTLLRDDMVRRIDRAVADKPLPPFVPPPVWAAGTHAASAVVRHANGIFMARRDTSSEPPDDDWLPLVVGIAGMDMRMDDERTLALRARLSDGTHCEMVRTLAVPITRGDWSADIDYAEGDRVFRAGEYHALKASKGIEPGTDDSAVWLKVGGKTRKALSLSLDDDGNMTESGRVIGSIKPMVRELLADLANKHGK